MLARLAFLLASALALLPTATLAERNREIIRSPVYLEPQQRVAVEGGRRLNLYCIGTGSPTVVFDSGLGEDMKVWALVQPQVATHGRACAYDRAGLGFSDPSPAQRTSTFLVEDLRRLLAAAHLDPPYLLVGHSFGGMNVKLYAEIHRGEVAGLVFVDPSHEDLARRAWALSPERKAANARYNLFLQECLAATPEMFIEGSTLKEGCATPPNAARFSDEINAMESARDLRYDVRYAWISEQLNVWTTSADMLRAARRPLDDLPLVVLTHEPLARQGKESQEMTDAQNALRTELHQDIARMSTRGTLHTVHDSSHHFQLDQPQKVTAAIVEVLESARAPRRR